LLGGRTIEVVEASCRFFADAVFKTNLAITALDIGGACGAQAVDASDTIAVVGGFARERNAFTDALDLVRGTPQIAWDICAAVTVTNLLYAKITFWDTRGIDALARGQIAGQSLCTI